MGHLGHLRSVYINRCQMRRPPLGRVLWRPRKWIMVRRRTSELLNNVPKVILINVVNLRLWLLPSSIRESGLMHWTFSNIFPNLVNTQVLIILIFRIIHITHTRNQKTLIRLSSISKIHYIKTLTDHHKAAKNFKT